jgi:hypothetical protein
MDNSFQQGLDAASDGSFAVVYRNDDADERKIIGHFVPLHPWGIESGIPPDGTTFWPCISKPFVKARIFLNMYGIFCIASKQFLVGVDVIFVVFVLDIVIFDLIHPYGDALHVFQVFFERLSSINST